METRRVEQCSHPRPDQSTAKKYDADSSEQKATRRESVLHRYTTQILTKTQQPDPSDTSSESSPEPATQRRRISPASSRDEAYDSDNAASGGPDTSIPDAVKKMVRFALACEYQRRPIRRPDITDKVLGAGHSRNFKRVFEQAQARLQSVFGMEMVELPARERVTIREKRAQKGAPANKAPASWVLRSTLPTEFHDPAILPPSAAPTAAEEGMYTSIYTVLIALISLSGGALPEAKMERYLRRLGMEDQTPVTGYAKTEQLLKRMEKEGYLLKVKEAATAGEEDVSWHVGPRGKVEVGDDGVRGLGSAVYGDLNEEEETELQRRLMRSLGINERQAVEKADEHSGDREKKKRGRKRKDEPEEEEEEDDDDDNDDDEG